MTTKIHVVNFGPDLVEAEISPSDKRKIYQQGSADFYVYEGQQVTIKEVKPDIVTTA